MLLKHPRSGTRWSFDRQLLGQLLGFGSWMTLSNLIGPFMVSADRYLIAAVLSAQLVAFYTVPQDLVIRLLLVPTAVATSLFPRLSLLYSEYNQAAFHQLYRRAYTLLALVMGGVLGALAWVAQPGLRLWLGDAFAEAAWPLSLVLLLGIFFNSLALLPLTALHAMRIVKKTSLLHLLELLVYLPVLWWLLQRYGLLGAAWAWTIRTGIDWLALQLLYRRARHQANLQ
jgi:O-antigen/teichoic acid export membrane protein